MGKLRKKVSKNTYVRTFGLDAQRGGNYSYPYYRGRLRGGTFPTAAFKWIASRAGDGLKRVGRRGFKRLKKEVFKQALKHAPAVMFGRTSIKGAAKKSLPVIGRNMVSGLSKIVNEEMFSGGKGKKKKPAKKKKKPVKKRQKGGMHSRAISTGIMKRSGAGNVFGD